MDYNVLLVDLDPQGNASTGCGVDTRALDATAFEVMTGEAEMADTVVSLEALGFDLLPSNSDLTAAEVSLLQTEGREYRLRTALEDVAHRYGWVIIDCPPSLNILTLNALIAAHGVLIPMQCEYYALEGLTALLETVEGVRQQANPSLSIEGLLRTMYDPRNGLTRDVSRQLIQYFGDRVFRTVIPRNVRLAEAPSHGLPAILYDRQSRGAVAYMALAGEIKRKHEEDDTP